MKLQIVSYLGANAKDAWNKLQQNKTKWWNGLKDVVKKVLVTTATIEMMAADV